MLNKALIHSVKKKQHGLQSLSTAESSRITAVYNFHIAYINRFVESSLDVTAGNVVTQRTLTCITFTWLWLPRSVCALVG